MTDEDRPNFERLIYRLLVFVLVTGFYALVLRWGWGWHITPSTGLAAPGLGNCLGIVLLLRLALLRTDGQRDGYLDFNRRLCLHVCQLTLFAAAMYVASWLPF